MDDRKLDTEAMFDMFGRWLNDYPILSIEDPVAEDAEAGFVAFTAGKKTPATSSATIFS